MAERTVYTHCNFCEAMCGLEVIAEGDAIKSIRPDMDSGNWGDFCIKGARADRLRTHGYRIRQPMKRVGGRYVATSYEQAIDEIADALTRLRDEHGPDSIGDFRGNPAGFNISNSAFNAAFLAALGSKNHFDVGSIDQNAFHYVGAQMYGSEWFCLQTDIDKTDFILLIGSNPAVSAMSWMGGTPDGWRRVKAMVARGGEFVLVDPRRTESASAATQHIAPLPEQDWALLLMLLKTIFDEGLHDRDACTAVNGLDRLRALVDRCDPADLAMRCEISLALAADLARRFARAPNAACITRTGPAQGRNGALAEWLGNVLNVVTGRLGKAGGRYYNNRIVDVAAVARVMMPASDTPSRVRGINSITGGRMLSELADEIETPGPGQVRAMIINSANPVVSGPNGARLDRVLARLDLLVCIDMFQRESHRHAHWLIPGTHFLERTIINLLSAGMRSDSYVLASRQVVPPPEGIRHEWEFFRDLARAMGLTLFSFSDDPTPAMLEDALAAMDAVHVSRAQILDAPHGVTAETGEVPGMADVLHTPDRRVNIAPAALIEQLADRLAEPATRPDRETFPYQIISKRSLATMNSFLGETIAEDMRDKPGGTIEISPEDAARDSLVDGELVAVSSQVGTVEVRVAISPEIRPGVAVMAHGWGTRMFDPASGAVREAHGANRNLLVSDQELDSLTGVPRLNGTPVRITRRSPSPARSSGALLRI